MEEKIVKPNTVKVIMDYKFRISYDNGATETICTRTPPQLDPQLVGFINFVIKKGNVRQINLNKVRNIDFTVDESTEVNLIT